MPERWNQFRGWKEKGRGKSGLGNICLKYFNCVWSPGQLALLLCRVLVSHLLIKWSVYFPVQVHLWKSDALLQEVQTCLCRTVGTRMSSTELITVRRQHENLFRRGGSQQRKRIPSTLVMPYRKQRETKASKVNKIKEIKKKEKKEIKNRKRKSNSSSFSQRYRII